MTPDIQIAKTDGNLGVVSNTERILAIVGPASAGTSNVAASYVNKDDVITAFTSGKLVEALSYCIAQGVPCVGIKSAATTAAAYGTIDHSGVLGTATVAAGSTAPDSDFDAVVKITTGGALGTAGIVFSYSLDDGGNYSVPQALGTSLTMTLARGVSFTLSSSTSTLLAGDVFRVSTKGPKSTTGDLAAALTALSDYSGEWLRVLVLADADDTILAQLDTFVKTFHTQGKYPEAITCTRARDVAGAEDRATFQAAMATIAAGVQSDEVSCCVDACELVSVVNGWRLRQPPSIPYAARLMLIDDSQDAAAKSDGALPGVFVETAAGLRNFHDERRYPGLDVLGFTTLRTWGGRPISPGVYVNNPRLLSGAGSDYRYFQLSAIINRIIESAYSLLQPRLSQTVLVDPSSGKIRESVAKGIEDSISAELRTLYQDPARVSGIQFSLSRTDDVLGTDTLHFSINAVPLAYVKHFIGKTGLVRVLPTA